VKLCTVCGVVSSRAGSRCTDHARQSNRSRHNGLYSTRAWQRLSARVVARHRGQYGNHCPGYGRGAHPAVDLTADHVVPLAAGGAPFDIGNTAVLCRSCNSTKGASEPDRGYPHVDTVPAEDREHAVRVSLDELRQRRWELERADDAARVLVERLELAARPADVAIVRALRARLWIDHRANASPDEPAKP
jgi:5-methylcytosine-specific restriction protein A